MVFYEQMNDVQSRIALLQDKGWTLASVARALGVTVNAVEKWKAGDRHPRTEKPILDALNHLMKRKPPKKKVYQKTVGTK